MVQLRAFSALIWACVNRALVLNKAQNWFQINHQVAGSGQFRWQSNRFESNHFFRLAFVTWHRTDIFYKLNLHACTTLVDRQIQLKAGTTSEEKGVLLFHLSKRIWRLNKDGTMMFLRVWGNNNLLLRNSNTTLHQSILAAWWHHSA